MSGFYCEENKIESRMAPRHSPQGVVEISYKVDGNGGTISSALHNTKPERSDSLEFVDRVTGPRANFAS
jgi:hypothetical protein